MEIRRFFTSKFNKLDNQIIIDGDEFHYLYKVLRQKVGYKIIVCLDDEGLDYNCTITAIENDRAIANIDSITENDTVTKQNVVLCQALPKGDKSSLIIQKIVELGASGLILFNSQFVNESKCNIERLDKIAIEACKQCGRSTAIKVEGLVDYDDMLDRIKDFDVIILPYENAEYGSIRDIKELKEAKNIAIIIGSEGGFTEEEVLKAKDCGAKVVSLGKRILRCETAAIITTGIVMYEIGELSK